MDGSIWRVAETVRGMLRTRPTRHRLSRVICLSLALLLVWMTVPWQTDRPARAAPAPAISGLHVVGNQILNGNNQPVRLRGVNRTSGEYGCIFDFAIFDGPIDAAAIQAMLSWKINVVRIPLNEDCWLNINTAGIDPQYVGANYRNTVIDYVTRLTEAGIAVIVDLHWAAPGAVRADKQLPMANRDHSVEFWTQVANSFKSNSAVIFDLYNEPYPDNNMDTVAAWQCLRDGGNCPGVTYPDGGGNEVPYTAAGMQELLNTVRATGATNLVMVAGVAYTGVLSRWVEYRPTDTLNPPNIAASVHIYPPSSQCSDVACWDQYLAPLVASYPLIAGEIGQQTCAHDRIDTVIDWLEGKQQHHLAWAWWTESCDGTPNAMGEVNYYGLITSYNTGAPTQGYGQGYKDRLAALVGAPPPAASFTAAATVSPASVAPGGTVAITANVTSASGGTAVVDVEVHDAADTKIFQQYFENEAFAAGQTRSFAVSWPVSASAALGSYKVQVGVFSPGWATEYVYNSDAAQVAVSAASFTPTATTTPTPTPTTTTGEPCAPRPNVAVTTRSIGGGRLEATIQSQTSSGTPSNGLERIVFGAVQNSSVQINGGSAGSGATVPLNGAERVVFVVTRQATGQAMMVPFTVRDRCGDWPSFVGAGPNAGL
jgi:hypothetical protein